MSMPQSVSFEGVGLPSLERAPRVPQIRVTAHREVADVLDLWAELEASVPHSIYQTRRWLVPWIETVGAAAGIRPFFVVLRDRYGAPVGLLPLGLVRRGPLRVATFLGGKDANFNMGLVRPEIAMTAALLRTLLRDAARLFGRDRPAIYALQNMPLAWEGAANLLAALPHQPAPSFAYETTLPAQAETYFAATLSKDTRKKLRKKESRLAALAPVAHVCAGNDDEARAILNTLFAQKAARLGEKGIRSGLLERCTQEFFARVTTPSRGTAPTVELHALKSGERIVATFAGSTYRGRFSGMVNSFDEDPEIGKSSPGDLLLTKLIAAKCADAVTHFDLGIGEARYKETFCRSPVPLVDGFVGVSLPGRLLRPLLAVASRGKRALKRNERARSVLTRARRLLRRPN